MTRTREVTNLMCLADGYLGVATITFASLTARRETVWLCLVLAHVGECRCQTGNRDCCCVSFCDLGQYRTQRGLADRRFR